MPAIGGTLEQFQRLPAAMSPVAFAVRAPLSKNVRLDARERAAPVRLPPRRHAVATQALALPVLGHAVVAPMLVSAQMLLRDPNGLVGLSVLLGAAAAELAKRQGKVQRATWAALAGAAPIVLQHAVGALIVRAGIDAARVPVQAVIDTGLSTITGTTLALASLVIKAPWADSARGFDGPVAPVIGRFVVAAVAAPVVFHAVMASAWPTLAKHAARAAIYAINPMLMTAATFV